mmetsp:Transcript_18817/g.29501  ORF Transcript_18817/g.29501 Transcript_18817/m.29501 type:complete len:161 (+) Transcript_18817:120-602(+)|eukprot:CAMPEP_0201729574 /NCGR_PEP_ID=MMETSP0593-20130828/19513_1 /ASSEMBLY_ACC=CAM_ASM_000672 /TAXON_ID=267983 /ORGANISM="Skeletonema japonicum, Strain CCMP2506" /LENGTH=160 /DNA_ID=CAMNT_0048221939 /DNA_START=95 /DNA_END=577 /DNA_ORIENTATION=+
MTREEQSIVHLQALKGVLSVLKPQIQPTMNAMSLQRDQIENKTAEFNKRFRDQLVEYHQARKKLEELEMSALHRDKNVKVLNDQLEQLTLQLDEVKKQIREKGRSMTDTTHLLDTQRAVQRLKEENREFDILIGVLYHEVTQARKGEVKIQSEDADSDEE